MSLIAPEVVVENIIQQGFADLKTTSATDIPLIFSQFPTDYQTDAINFLAGLTVNVVFNYYFDPALLPSFNIVLSSEGEQQQFLNDGVEYADQNPNTLDYEESGSDWQATITLVIRAEKSRQAIILYNLAKWILLKNRQTFEQNFIKATVFSGSDLNYEAERSPTYVFSRIIRINCRVLNTVETNITSDPTISQVVSGFGSEVRALSQVDEESTS